MGWNLAAAVNIHIAVRESVFDFERLTETAPDAAVTAVNRKRELIKNKIIGRERCIKEAFSVIGIGGVNKIIEFVRIGNAVISRRRNKRFSLFCVINEERRKLFNCAEILFGA